MSGLLIAATRLGNVRDRGFRMSDRSRYTVWIPIPHRGSTVVMSSGCSVTRYTGGGGKGEAQRGERIPKYTGLEQRIRTRPSRRSRQTQRRKSPGPSPGFNSQPINGARWSKTVARRVDREWARPWLIVKGTARGSVGASHQTGWGRPWSSPGSFFPGVAPQEPGLDGKVTCPLSLLDSRR